MTMNIIILLQNDSQLASSPRRVLAWDCALPHRASCLSCFCHRNVSALTAAFLSPEKAPARWGLVHLCG